MGFLHGKRPRGEQAAVDEQERPERRRGRTKDSRDPLFRGSKAPRGACPGVRTSGHQNKVWKALPPSGSGRRHGAGSRAFVPHRLGCAALPLGRLCWPAYLVSVARACCRCASARARALPAPRSSESRRVRPRGGNRLGSLTASGPGASSAQRAGKPPATRGRPATRTLGSVAHEKEGIRAIPERRLPVPRQPRSSSAQTK